MDEPIYDLLAHLAVDRHGVGKTGVRGKQCRQGCKEYEKERCNDAGNGKHAMTIRMVRYADEESRHGEQPAAPGIHDRRGPGGRVADMSLTGTHSAFSVPTDGLKKWAACPKIRRRQGARRA